MTSRLGIAILNVKTYYSLCINLPAMSNISEEDVRRAADIREWLTKQIGDKQEEIERLRTILLIIDMLLKRGSFKTAASLGTLSTIPSKKFSEASSSNRSHDEVNTISESDSPESELGKSIPLQSHQNESRDQGRGERYLETKELRRIKDNLLLCTASISSAYVEIIPAEGIMLSVEIQPFKSFFQNRILEGMRSRDLEKANKGEISETDCLSYQIDTDDESHIRRIVIRNYRARDRLNEIFNTCTWVLTRMVERKGG